MATKQSSKLLWLPFLLLPATLTACPDEGGRPIGAICSDDAACASGLCAENVCLLPTSDNDSDGLTNEFEARIGSNPLERDTDGDGVSDADELATDRTVTDTDLDGHADIIESKTADKDGDCITDQYDADDENMNTDLSPMLPVVCRRAGVCAEPASLSVACPAGVATCVYTAVPTFADPETQCDRVDENCDGKTDEGFADVNGDHIGDACEALHHLVFRNVPATATAGTPFAVQLALQNERNEDVTEFAPPEVSLALDPASATFVPGASLTADGIVHFDAVTIADAGEGLVLVATAGNFTARSTPITVTATNVPVPGFAGAPATVPAGLAFPLTVEVRRPGGALATDYAGTLTFTSSDDAAATLPAPVTLTAADGGTKTVSGFTLQTLGTRHLKVRDAALGTESEIALEVIPGSDTRLELTGEPTTTAGAGYVLHIRAVDQFGNLLPDYTGTVRITANDAGARLPADLTFGTGSPGVVSTDEIFFHLAKDTILTVTDVSDASITASHVVHVNPGSRATLDLACGATSLAAGTPFTCVLTALDSEHNVATGYLGVVTVTSTDTSLVFGNIVFGAADQGVRTLVDLVFQQVGVQTLAVDDGTGHAEYTITVSHGPAAVLTASPLPLTMVAGVTASFTVTVSDAFGNVATSFAGTLPITTSDTHGNVPHETILSAADAGHKDVTVSFTTAGPQTVSVTGPGFPAANATAEVATQVVPGAVASAAWRIQPTSGSVNVPMAQVELGLFDTYGNLASNALPTDVHLRLGINPGGAHLTGGGTTATESGVVRFSGWTVDQAGEGMTLIADVTGIGPVASAPFDAAWRAPVVTAVDAKPSGRGCVPIYYTVSQPDGHPVDVVVELATGDADFPWRRLPLAGVSSDGALQLDTSPDGIDRTFTWDFAREFHVTNLHVAAGALRVTASIGKVQGGATNQDPFDVLGAYHPFTTPFPLTLAGPVARVAAGDIDGDGHLDVIIPGANASLAVLSGAADGTFYENDYTLFVEAGFPIQLADVAIAHTQASAPTVAFLDSGNGTVWMTNYNGDGGFNARNIRPCGNDFAVAMAFGHFGYGQTDLAVGCDGEGPYWVIMALNAGGWYQANVVDAGASVHALAAADLDYDGLDDVVAGTDSGLSAWHNEQQVMNPVQDIQTNARVAEVVLSDRNDDHRLEAVYLDVNGKSAMFAGQAGLPFFGTAAQVVDSGPGPTDFKQLGTMDTDDDGIADLLLSSPTRGLFIERGSVSRSIDGPESIATADAPNLTPERFVRLPHAGLRDELGVLYQANDGTWAFGVWSQEGELCTPNADAPAGVANEAPRLVAAVDADRDGNVDLIGFYDQGNFPRFATSLGRGDGGFQPRTISRALEVLPYSATALVSGDFTGDGVPDVVIGFDDGHIELYRANPIDGFRYSGPVTFSEPAGVTALAAADLDNDGQLDLLVGTGDEALVVHYPIGTDFESGETVTVADVGLITHIAAGDLDVDGHDEIAFSVANGRDAICVMATTVDAAGNAERAFDRPICSPNASGLPPGGDAYEVQALRIVDFADDGRRELAVGLGARVTELNPTGPGWLVRRAALGRGTATVNVVGATRLCDGLDQLAFGHFDDVPGFDLVAACRGDQALQTYLMSGNVAQPGSSVAVGSTYDRVLATGDFDGDGRDDIAFDGAVYRTLGSGGEPQSDGHFRMLGATVDEWQAAATLNFDGDRNTDVAVVGTRVYDTGDGLGCDLELEIADANGPHATYTLNNIIYPSTFTPVAHIATGDFDGDHRSDLALFYGVSSYRMGLRVVFRDRFGGLDPAENYEQLVDYDFSPDALAAADVDRDGIDDIIAAGTNSDGTSSFQIFEQHPQNGTRDVFRPYNDSDVPTNIRRIVVGDFDRGGYGLEIAVAGFCAGVGECIRFFREEGCYPGNNACYGFYDGIDTTFRGSQSTFADVAALDVNHDGVTDLVVTTADAVADSPAYSTVLLLGQSRGGFNYVRDYFSAVGPATLPNLVVADLDADGAPDLVTVSEIGKTRVDVRVSLRTEQDWRFASVAAGHPTAVLPVRSNDRWGILLLEGGGTRLVPQLSP